MKILTSWLRLYVPNIPVDDHHLAGDLTLRGIAVEGVQGLGPGNGHMFEMDITTNRVDAMNHYGIAREAATIYNLPLAPLIPAQAPSSSGKLPSHHESSSRPEAALLPPERRDPRISPEAPQAPNAQAKPFPIRIEAPELCGRFTAQVLRDVTIAPSTGRVAEYFNLLGQKQISNAVDASNFVLVGMGHPTHAFDLDKIQGGIVVRLARKDERLKLLDGTERTLEADDLVVADEVKPLALAGVMGGWDSMITPETKHILVEAAWFDPASIRRSGRRHGLHTDASHRFERGADFNAAPIANRLVSELILEHGGRPEGELIDLVIPEIQARTASRPPIALSVQQVQRHLGATLEDTPNRSALTSSLVHQYLTALGCTLTATDSAAYKPSTKKTGMVNPGFVNPGFENPSAAIPNTPQSALSLPQGPTLAGAGRSSAIESPAYFQVQLPSWRLDLEREIDLIEEVARVFGYNRFGNTLPTPGIVIAHPLAAKEAAIRSRLLALGFSESISTTFASQSDSELFYNPTLQEPTSLPVAMENPLSDEASLLRPSLVPGMIGMLTHNLNRDVKEVRLFEQGHIFTGTVPADGDAIEAVHESPQLSLGLTTATPQRTSLHPAADVSFFELKGAIESILSLFDLNPAPQAEAASSTPPPTASSATLTFTPEAPAWLQPGRSATALVRNQPMAHFGELAQLQKESRKLRQPIYLAQLDLARLYEFPLRKVTARDLSRFQAVERDFSFTFPDTTPWHAIAAAIHALAIPELQRLTPTEIFRDPKGKSVPPAHYALLLKCVFQSSGHTLRDDELTSWWSSIISTLTQLGGTIRAPETALA